MTWSESPAVRGELEFLAPASTLRRQFIGPGARTATARTERHPVAIRDGRPVQHTFDLDVHGFELVDHHSAVTDLTDTAQLEAYYVAEVCRLVQQELGAHLVLSRGWELRRSVVPAEHGAQPPAGGVHLDYAPDHHDPAREWWYFAGMTRDEVLLIELGNTDRSVARAAPHAAFPDGAGHGAVPRHSIEVRTFAYVHRARTGRRRHLPRAGHTPGCRSGRRQSAETVSEAGRRCTPCRSSSR